MKIGQRIRAIRLEKGLSQTQLSDLINVDNSLLCKIESGDTNGSLNTLKKIAEALGVPIGKLLDEKSA
ncbi:MAG: helix-turn-helix domain-containing protein [bacterium]